jgi:RNA polymerase sigma factor (sigma-70 family)
VASVSFLRDRGELVRRFKAGDKCALEEVYRSYVKMVAAVIRSKCFRPVAGNLSPGDLADIVQETFIRAFSESGRSGYDGIREYGPYLGRIACNTMVQWSRRHRREIPCAMSEDDFALEQVPAEIGPWEDPGVLQSVEDYLLDLPVEMRRFHELRYRQNLGQDEVASSMGLSRQNVRTMEKRLRDGLAAYLREHDRLAVNE